MSRARDRRAAVEKDAAGRLMTSRPHVADLQGSRFYAILDTAYVPRDRWKETNAALIAGGADLIQIRAKRETAKDREALLQEILPMFDLGGGRSPHLIVNDDVALCARHPGVGLHVGQDDLPPPEARRRIGTDRILGLSTHSRAQATAALGLPPGVLSYFCIGPVFSTQTKPEYQPVGLDLVQWTAARRPALPWFCIGGINRRNVGEVASAGASRVVVVSDVLLADDPGEAVAEIRRRISGV